MAQVMGVMTDNVLQTLQQLIQDVIAPDVRELKVRVSSLEKQMDVRFDAVDVRFNALEQKYDARFRGIDTRFDALDQRFVSFDQKNDAQFRAVLAAIAELKAQSELTTMRMIAGLSERVAVLEAQRS
jgi:phosphate uptake regulator